MSVQTELRRRKIERETQNLVSLMKWRVRNAELFLQCRNPVRAQAYISGHRDQEYPVQKEGGLS